MTELDQVLAGITARQARARVCLRGDLIAEHEQAEADLRKALADDQTENRHAAAPAVARRVVDLEQQIDAASTDFVMQAIGQRAWSDLLAEHPPSEEDRADGWAFNSRTFLVAAVGASCVSPAGMTAAGAERLFSLVNLKQWAAITGAALHANSAGDPGKSAAASEVLRGYATRSEERGSTESPAPSS